jgi:hypothetical protein
MRDVFQNHLLQLVALTAMEPPADFTADSVRNEKVKVLQGIRTPGPSSVVRGQYGRGYVEGVEVPGYPEEQGVPTGSMTETFVAAKLTIENWRWAAVLRPAGKRLPKRDDDRDPVHPAAAPAVRGTGERGPPAERPRRPRPAGRGRLARDRSQGPGPGLTLRTVTMVSSRRPSAATCPRRTSG